MYFILDSFAGRDFLLVRKGTKLQFVLLRQDFRRRGLGFIYTILYADSTEWLNFTSIIIPSLCSLIVSDAPLVSLSSST